MSNEHNSITLEELKTYLYSIEKKETEEKLNQINKYKEEEKNKHKNRKTKDIKDVQKSVSEKYQRWNQTKDKILNLLNECESIQLDIEEIEISQYMLYRVDIRSAEKILEKAKKRLDKRYKDNFKKVINLMHIFPELDYIENIDLGIHKTNTKALDKAKQEFPEEYTEEQRMELIKNELEIIEKSEAFNSIPIPHEILKSSDKEVQSKMPKFNSIRQKRKNILSTMREDYIKLTEPRELEQIIDDALINIDGIEDILTKSEYKNIKNKLIKRKHKVIKSTSEIRNVIKWKEKKTGIINFNIQEARLGRMENLRCEMAEASRVIKMNETTKAEEKLEELKLAYDKEKQYASVIEKLGEDGNINGTSELVAFENQIASFEKRIENSKKIIKDQEEKIAEIKKELIILWKIEIENTLSNKKENLLALAEENKKNQPQKKNFLGLKRSHKAKH